MSSSRFIHITLNCNHAVSLAQTLSGLSKSDEHKILIYDRRVHKNNYINETKKLFQNTHILENNVHFNNDQIVIFHGLFMKISLDLLRQLVASPLKTVWIIWGGDIMLLKQKENIAFLNQLDYVVCAPGELLPYPELIVPQIFLNLNLTSEGIVKRFKKENLVVLGNSGDPSNQHEYLLEIARNYKNADIYIPFSYNKSDEYLEKVIEKTKLLNMYDRVSFQTDTISLEEYKKIFQRSKVFLTAHNRQQSFGTIQIAYTSNCEVYLRKTIVLNSGERVVNPSYMNSLMLGYSNIKDIVDLEVSKASINLPPEVKNNINELSMANVKNIEKTFEILKR